MVVIVRERERSTEGCMKWAERVLGLFYPSFPVGCGRRDVGLFPNCKGEREQPTAADLN